MKNRAVSILREKPVGLLVAASVGAVILFWAGAIALASIVSGTPATGGSTQVTTTNVTVNKPSSSQGDVLLATIAIHGGSSAIVSGVPSGWHLIASTTNDANLSLLTYWKADSGSEPSSYTWTVNGQTTGEGAITPYSGVDSSNPIDASDAPGNTGLSATATTSAITTTNASDTAVAIFAVDEGKTNNSGSYFSTPSGMSEKLDVSNTPFGPSLALDEEAQNAAGTFASASSSISGGNKPKNWATQVLALKPSSPIPTPLDYWKMDGNSNDSVGSVNGADTDMSYSTSSGKVNEGASFNGSTSRILLGHMLTGQVNVSVAAWIKTSDATDQQFIWAQREGPNPMPAEALFYVENGKLNFSTAGSGGGNDDAEVSNNTTVADGNWHLVGVSENGDTYTYYVDGQPDGSFTSSLTPETYDTARTGDIGFDQLDFGALGQGHFFNGSIDEVGLWNTTLTSDNFVQLYNSGVGRTYPF
jgi:hypothetical protein